MLTLANRRAEWIWRERAPGEGPSGSPFARVDFEADRNRYVYFRRTFELPAAARRATGTVSADGRYQLFVNGRFVGRGPARCDPLWQCADAHDLAPFLHGGWNVVAVLVHSYGRDMSWYQLPRAEWARFFGCGGLFFQCDVALAEGSALAVDSDGSWRHLVSEAWERDTPGGAVGFVEVYDAWREPLGWREVEFDDGDWRPAAVLRAPSLNRAPELQPFPVMVPRDIPPLLEEERFPAAVAACGEVAEAADAPSLPEQMEREDLHPLARCVVRNVEALLSPEGEAEVQTAPGWAVAVVLDFGADVSGYPRLVLDGPAGAVVDIAYSERLAGQRVEIVGGGPVTSPNTHRYVLREGPQTWEKFEWAGFRYLQLTVRDCPQGLRLRSAGVNFTSYPVTERGAFACSDELLTRIWRAGAYTLQLCMHDGYEDCPSREQRQWVGDAYVEMLVDFAAFGDLRLAAKLLRQVAQSQRPDGMTQMATPGDVAARWALYIPDYCLYWIMAIGEYVRYSGNGGIVGEFFPSVAKAVGWFERHLDGDGLLNEVPGWVFIDWADVDRRGQCTALNALFYRALTEGAAMARQQGASAVAERWAGLAERVRDAINRLLWDEERGVYVDARVGGVPGRRVSQQANALCIAFEIAPGERWPRILATILDEGRLKVTSTGAGDHAGADFDEERDIVLAQPFFMHHVHRALARAGRHEALVENIRRRWGAMLEAGATTFWEHWHGRASQCHAWSATPTYDLSTEVLGVRPLKPGFREFAVEPKPVDLAWARGVFPSRRGDIAVSWERAEGGLRLELTVPEGTTAQVALPKLDGRAWTAVEVDGAAVWEGGAFQENAVGVSAAADEEEALRLWLTAPGAHRLEARA